MRRPQTPRLRRAFDIWQIVYIDLMTNVMIFFVVLWAVQSRPTKSGISDNIGTETVKMVSLPGDVLFSSGKSERVSAMGTSRDADTPVRRTRRFRSKRSRRLRATS